MIIRKGTTEDLPFVGLLWLKMVKELAPEYTPNAAWWLKMAFNMIRLGSYHIWIAEDKPFSPVGFVDYFIYPEPATGKIHVVGQHFYVEPEYRNSRVSFKLYKSAVKHAKTQTGIMEMFAFKGQADIWEKKGYKPIRTMLRKEIRNV